MAAFDASARTADRRNGALAEPGPQLKSECAVRPRSPGALSLLAAPHLPPPPIRLLERKRREEQETNMERKLMITEPFREVQSLCSEQLMTSKPSGHENVSKRWHLKNQNQDDQDAAAAGNTSLSAAKRLSVINPSASRNGERVFPMAWVSRQRHTNTEDDWGMHCSVSQYWVQHRTCGKQIIVGQRPTSPRCNQPATQTDRQTQTDRGRDRDLSEKRSSKTQMSDRCADGRSCAHWSLDSVNGVADCVVVCVQNMSQWSPRQSSAKWQQSPTRTNSTSVKSNSNEAPIWKLVTMLKKALKMFWWNTSSSMSDSDSAGSSHIVTTRHLRFFVRRVTEKHHRDWLGAWMRRLATFPLWRYLLPGPLC